MPQRKRAAAKEKREFLGIFEPEECLVGHTRVLVFGGDARAFAFGDGNGVGLSDPVLALVFV